MKHVVTAVALLALAACQQEEPATPPTDTSATVPSAQPAPAEPPASASATPEVRPASPSPTPSASAIPAAAQGRWGLVPADCTSTRGDAKGLLVVEPNTLRFYESRGTLKSIKDASNTRIRAAFEFSGEGMTWQRDETLDVQDNGKTLVRREYGEDAAPGPFKYTRC